MHLLASSLLLSIVAMCVAADGWLGIYLEPEHDAPRVREFVPGSPAEAAGMKAGDVILAIDVTLTPDVRALLVALVATKPGQKVAVRVARDDKELTLQVTLGERPAGGGVPPEPAPPDPTPQKGQPPSPSGEQRASLPILRDLAAAKVAAATSGLSLLVIYAAKDTAVAAAQRQALQADLVLDALMGFVVVWVDAEDGKVAAPVVESHVAGVLLWQRAYPLTAAQLHEALTADIGQEAAQRLANEARRLAAVVAELRAEIERLRAERNGSSSPGPSNRPSK